MISTAGYQVGGQERGLKRGRERSWRNPRSAQLLKDNEAVVVQSRKKKEEEKWEETTRREKENMQEIRKHLAARTRHKTWKNPPCASAKSQVAKRDQ